MNSPRPQPDSSTTRRRISPPAFLLLATALLATAARAETTGSSGATEITSLPYTITQPGVYCLLPPAGVNPFPATTPLPGSIAIAINASNVVLDLNGYTLSNPGAPNNGYIGVYSSIAGGVRNDTIAVSPGASICTLRTGIIRNATALCWRISTSAAPATAASKSTAGATPCAAAAWITIRRRGDITASASRGRAPASLTMTSAT